MAFTFNKETRRSLRERIRDGIGTVVQAPANILGVGGGGSGGGGGGGGGSGEGIMGKGGGGPSTLLHQQKKSHSVDSTVLQETAEDSINARKGGSACQLTSANVMTTGGAAGATVSSLLLSSSGGAGGTGGLSGGPSSVASSASSLPPPSPTYLTAESSSNTPGSGGDHGDGSSRSGSVSSCSSSTSSSPSKYRTYVVKTNDTVTSIAASFDCTPTELMRVNRLITARVLFPGQVLKIPHKRTTSTSGQQPPSISDSTTETSQVHHHNIQNLPQPGHHPHGHHHHHHHDPATANILESITYAQRKFLKIKVRHVTDGNGVVSGTLLITPNAVMFDPNVSDPLVIEQGAEMYGIIVPIEYIIGASIWSDICGMRVRGKEAFIPPGPRPVLWGVDFASGGGSAVLSDLQQPGRGTPTVLEEQAGDADAATETKAEEEEKKRDATAAEVVVVEGTAAAAAGGGDGDKVSEEKEETSTTDECQKQKSEVEESHNSNNNNSNNHHSNNNNNNGNESPTSSNNNGNSRFEAVTDHPLKDESSSSSSSNTTTVSTVTPESSVATWYFCLTIGRPKPQDGGGGGGGADQQANRARRNPFCVTYGQKNTVRPEFWFSVGKEQVPELFKYWMFWWPHLYGDVDLKVVSDRGFQLIDWDNLDVAGWRLDSTPGVGGGAVSGGNGGAPGAPRPRTSNEEGSEEQSMAQELNELTKESWEMLKQPYAKLSSFITTRGSSIMKSSSHSSQSSVSDGMATGGGEGGGGTDLGGGGGSGGVSHSSHGGHHRHGHHQQQQHGGSGSTSIFNSHHFSITNPMNSFFFESFSNISPNHSVFDDTDDDDEFGSFEQVVTNEELRNLLAIGGDEMMTIVPDLIGGKSEILEEEDIRNLTRHLTARAEGYPWTQIFTSSRDGFSLNSLYRRNSQMQEDSPVILVVQDTNARVFGALVSCSLHTSDSFYGTGQSFLFTLRPEFNVFKWTGENLFFVKGNHDGIWIGAGDGKFGLYVDGDLNCGRTEPCQTYGNASLTEPQDFIIKTLECWAFGNYVLDV